MNFTYFVIAEIAMNKIAIPKLIPYIPETLLIFNYIVALIRICGNISSYYWRH